MLFSCNSKNSKNSINTAAAPAFDTLQFQPDETINIADYSKDFTESITQTFSITPGKVSVIIAKKGLKVIIDPAVLEKEDGSTVDGKITVNIIELTTSEELFKSNAATVSNGRLLASGGSYFIGMECNGQKLQIKKGKLLQVEFPVLKENEMQLFYGQRDAANNMNWINAEQPLSFNTSGNYMEYNPPYPDSLIWQPYKGKHHLYESVNSKVIFDNRQMTMKEMVAVLQKKGIDKSIDTITVTWRDTGYNRYNIESYRYRMYSWKMYRIISCKELEAEKDSVAKEEKVKAQYILANKKYDEEWNRIKEENSFTNQLQKYYAPSLVNKLSWINCDRFYQRAQDIEVPLELPITFGDPVIEYFIIYKSFSGLISGKLGTADKQKYALANLPVGEPVTLIAFTKKNGQLFHCKEEFVTAKNKTVKLDFKNITAEEMSKMFGRNVRI
jgi:hypothetical protein